MRHLVLPRRLFTALALTVFSALALQPASANPAVVTTRTPYLAAFTACSGEVITLEGTIHSTVRFEADGDTTKQSVHANLQNVKGVSATGATYVLVHTETVSTNASGAFPREGTHVISFRLIRQGEDKTLESGDDIHSRVVIHFTVNANGTVTVDKSEIAAVCR